jgi:hypothetical protein
MQEQQKITPHDTLNPTFDVANAPLFDAVELERKRLNRTDFHNASALADITKLRPLDPDSGLLAIVVVADKALKLYGQKDEAGHIKPDVLYLTAADHNDGEQSSEDASVEDFVLVEPGITRTIGRDEVGAERLGLNSGPAVSRRHFSIALSANGALRLEDLHSAHGSSLITSAEHDVNPDGYGQKLGTLALTKAEHSKEKAEFTVSGIQYEVTSHIAVKEHERMLGLRSTDKDGKTRNFAIYRSLSEGGLRVTQGRDRKGRYMKGGINDVNWQYTQDTQLHPEFAEKLQRVLETVPVLPVQDSDILNIDDGAAYAASMDFGAERTVVGFGDKTLDDLLKKVPAGYLTKSAISSRLGVREDQATQSLESYVTQLNGALINGDVIPDFKSPVRSEVDEHPILGTVQREVYEQKGVEWYMAKDLDGRVWVDRIRYARSEPTAYGTDAQMIFSGLLTSKPIEHPTQTDALAEAMRPMSSDSVSYDDISQFLDTLEPVMRYRKERGINRTK